MGKINKSPLGKQHSNDFCPSMDLGISKSLRRNRICIVVFIFENDKNNFLKHTSVSFSIEFSYHISKYHHFSMP